MASRLLRRSGIAVGTVAELLGWKPDAVFHVGVGQYHQEVDVLHAEWPDAKWFGVEPHPKIMEKLQKDYPGGLFEGAVSDYVGGGTLHIPHRHKDGSSLFEHYQRADEEYSKIEVGVTTLDVLFDHPQYNFPHALLWMDCEGNEMAALHGGEKFIKNHIDVINIEMTSKPPGPGWCSPVDVHNLLMSYGFFRQWIHTQRFGSGQCDCIYVRGNLFKPEFCCCHCQIGLWEKWNHET